MHLDVYMLWDYLRNIIRSRKTAIGNGIISMSPSLLLEKVDDLACCLNKTIREKKTICAIICSDSLNSVISLLALWRLEMVPVPLSKNYGYTHNLKIIKKIDPKIIITDDIDYINMLEFTKPIYSIKDRKYYNDVNICSDNEMNTNLSDVAMIMCTSGTTGVPKGVVITESGLISNIEGIKSYFPINSDDTILIARPLYHCAVLTGEFLTGLCSGANIIFIDGSFNPFAISEYIKKQGITVLCGTPTLFMHLSKIIAKIGYKPDIRYMAISGECLTAEEAKEIRKTFCKTKIFNVYGLTEASPRVTFLPHELFDIYPESVGIPLPNIDIMIIDDDGKQASTNVDGQLIVRGPNIMKGYYKEDISKKIKNGWLYTGDRAFIDEQHFLYIKARIDDMIIKGGMNIYPKEIENEIKKDKRIEDVCAFGINKNNKMFIGIEVVLNERFLELKIDDIMKICSDRLPSYQLPDEIRISSDLQQNGSLKKVRRKNDNVSVDM